MRTSNITASNALFLSYPLVSHWRFEVVYTFDTGTSISARDLVINQPPLNGSCSIVPLTGTTSTLFTVTCINWLNDDDDEDIEDYALYSMTPHLGNTSNVDNPSMIAFGPQSTFQVRLPAGNGNTSVLDLFIVVRDTNDGIASFEMGSVTVLKDPADNVHSLISNVVTKAGNECAVRQLSVDHQNTFDQLLISLARDLDRMHADDRLDHVPLASVSVTSLGSAGRQTYHTLNVSAFDQFEKRMNYYAGVRDSVMPLTSDLVVGTSNTIKLQAAALAHITEATNQLTRASTVSSCLSLSRPRFSSHSEQADAGIEQMSSVGHQSLFSGHEHRTRRCSAGGHSDCPVCLECVDRTLFLSLLFCSTDSHLRLQAANAPLQQRTPGLDLDVTRANAFPVDYETDIELEWANPSR